MSDNPYDIYPYESVAIPATRPDKLALTSVLSGGPRPSVQGMRVLELGCAEGGNLLPLAYYDPSSTFVGLDYSVRQIEEANRVAQAAGITNIRFVHADFCDRDLRSKLGGDFDYTIAHGVYSWVAPEVRDRVLEICAEQLAPEGVCFLSYNVFPGWKVRGVLRELLLVEIAGIDDPSARAAQARAYVDRLARIIPDDPGHPYPELLAREMRILVDAEATTILHDHLEATNEAFYFSEVAATWDGRGLRYLGEALFNRVEAIRHDILRGFLRDQGFSGLALEQYVDLLGFGQMRASVLCRADAMSSGSPGLEVVEDLLVASDLRPRFQALELTLGEVAEFDGPGENVFGFESPHLKAALWLLAEHPGRGISFPDLVAGAEQLLADKNVLGEIAGEHRAKLREVLLGLHHKGLVELRLVEPEAEFSWGEVANPLIREEAERRGQITTPWHTGLGLDAFEMLLVPRLDGRQSQEELIMSLVEGASRGELKIEMDDVMVTDAEALRPIIHDLYETCLTRLARHGLLLASVGAASREA